MIEKTDSLETALSEIFIKHTPKLPKHIQKILVDWAPTLSIICALVCIFIARLSWISVYMADTVQPRTKFCGAYQCHAPIHSFSIWPWLGILSLCIEARLYLFAISNLRDKKRLGWRYLYYGLLINVAYLVTTLFTPYRDFYHFIGTLFYCTLGSYVLFQIRHRYVIHRRITPLAGT